MPTYFDVGSVDLCAQCFEYELMWALQVEASAENKRPNADIGLAT